MQSPEPHRDVDIHDGEDQGALPCHGRGGAEQPKELPSMEMEVDETPEDQDAELGAAPGQGKGSPEPSSTALQLVTNPADHDTSPPEECETPRVDFQAGDYQAPLQIEMQEVEQLKDQLPSVEMEVDATPEDQDAELVATPGQGKGSSDTSSTALQLTMSQSPCPADHDTSPPEACEPTRVDIQAGEDQAPMPPGGEVVHLLDLPSVEFLVHKTSPEKMQAQLPSVEMEVDATPEDQDAELGATPGQGKGSSDTSSTALQLTMSQSPCPADHDTSPPEACEPTRVDIQAGEDQAPMPPGGEVVHLLDLPSVEFLVHKTSPEKMQALSAPQVLHSHLQLAALTA